MDAQTLVDNTLPTLGASITLLRSVRGTHVRPNTAAVVCETVANDLAFLHDWITCQSTQRPMTPGRRASLYLVHREEIEAEVARGEHREDDL